MKKFILSILTAVTLIALASAYFQARTPVVGNLIGKSRSAVEKQLGKPAQVAKPDGGGVYLNWGNYPKQTGAMFDAAGKMTSFSVPATKSWKADLAKYKLSAAGVTPVEVKGKGGDRAFELRGLKGLPPGWICTFWEGFLLTFRKKE